MRRTIGCRVPIEKSNVLGEAIIKPAQGIKYTLYMSHKRTIATGKD